MFKTATSFPLLLLFLLLSTSAFLSRAQQTPLSPERPVNTGSGNDTVDVDDSTDITGNDTVIFDDSTDVTGNDTVIIDDSTDIAEDGSDSAEDGTDGADDDTDATDDDDGEVAEGIEEPEVAGLMEAAASEIGAQVRPPRCPTLKSCAPGCSRQRDARGCLRCYCFWDCRRRGCPRGFSCRPSPLLSLPAYVCQRRLRCPRISRPNFTSLYAARNACLRCEKNCNCLKCKPGYLCCRNWYGCVSCTRGIPY